MHLRKGSDNLKSRLIKELRKNGRENEKKEIE